MCCSLHSQPRFACQGNGLACTLALSCRCRKEQATGCPTLLQSHAVQPSDSKGVRLWQVGVVLSLLKVRSGV